MATASAVERANGYYNTIDDGGMDAYGYQMPAAPAYNAYNNYYNGHDQAEVVYTPYHHVSRTRRAPSPQNDNSLFRLVNELVRIELEFKAGLKSIFSPRGR